MTRTLVVGLLCVAVNAWAEVQETCSTYGEPRPQPDDLRATDIHASLREVAKKLSKASDVELAAAQADADIAAIQTTRFSDMPEPRARAAATLYWAMGRFASAGALRRLHAICHDAPLESLEQAARMARENPLVVQGALSTEGL